jgi:aryl-alcohol dehydrogenase-like predicted oxidoreductase
VLGDAIARLLETAGHTVEREYYFNDAGGQMDRFGASVEARYLQALGRDAKVPEDDQFGFLQQAQRAGKIRHVGLSEVSVAQIERARKFFPVVSVQNRYNLVDREWEDVVAYCERERIAFIPWYPLQAGEVAKRGLKQGVRKLLGRAPKSTPGLSEIARRHHAEPSQIALAWLLRRASVMLPIPGTSKKRHLEENVAASAIQLTDEEVRALT